MVEQMLPYLIKHIKTNLKHQGTSYAQKGLEDLKCGMELWRKAAKKLPTRRVGNTVSRSEVGKVLKERGNKIQELSKSISVLEQEPAQSSEGTMPEEDQAQSSRATKKRKQL